MGFNALAGIQGFNAGMKSVQDMQDQWDQQDIRAAQRQIADAQVQDNGDGTYSYLGQQFDKAPTPDQVNSGRVAGLANLMQKYGKTEDAMRLRLQGQQFDMGGLQLQAQRRQAQQDAKEDALMQSFEPLNKALTTGDFGTVAKAVQGIYNSNVGPVADGSHVSYSAPPPGSGHAAVMQKFKIDEKTGQAVPDGAPKPITASELHQQFREMQLAALAAINPAKYGQAYDQLVHNHDSLLVQRDQLAETTRHNQAGEKLQGDYQRGMLGNEARRIALEREKYGDARDDQSSRLGALDMIRTANATMRGALPGTPAYQAAEAQRDAGSTQYVGYGGDPSRIIDYQAGVPQGRAVGASGGKVPSQPTPEMRSIYEKAAAQAMAEGKNVADVLEGAGFTPEDFGIPGRRAQADSRLGAADAMYGAKKPTKPAEAGRRGEWKPSDGPATTYVPGIGVVQSDAGLAKAAADADARRKRAREEEAAAAREKGRSYARALPDDPVARARAIDAGGGYFDR